MRNVLSICRLLSISTATDKIYKEYICIFYLNNAGGFCSVVLGLKNLVQFANHRLLAITPLTREPVVYVQGETLKATGEHAARSFSLPGQLPSETRLGAEKWLS